MLRMIRSNWFPVFMLLLVQPTIELFENVDADLYCGRKECPLFYEEWVMHVSGGRATAKQVARLTKLILVSELPGFIDHYVFRAARAKDTDLHKNKRHTLVAKSPHVNWAQRQYPLNRQKRTSLLNVNWNDPQYSDMWFINRAREGEGYDMNVQEAWDLGYSGKGVVVTIMDDGVEHTHPDLVKNYDPKASCDLSDEDDDPMPDLKASESNRHGTRCAGQVAAQGNNSVCVVGVAFNARIGGIRMLDGYITDRVEARSLSFQNNYIDIYSGSWGPDDTGKMLEGPGYLAASALQKGVTTGRHGLGNIFIWASGNGGVTGDSCACDGYASSPNTLSVSGVGESNKRPWYVERCASTLVTTYSSGSDTERMIATVDTHHKCTSNHTGTSAAAPLAASIIALLLEANPKLSWRDVQYICLLTANTAPFADGNFTKNAVGRSYSEYYGYGLMDAGKMIRLGELWRTVPEQHQCTSMIQTFQIPLENHFNHTVPLNFTGCSSTSQQANRAAYSNTSQTYYLHYLEHVQIYGEIVYPRRGLLQITLTSPSGTESVLLPPRILDDHSGETNILKWPLTSVKFWGEPAAGAWQVRIDNLAGTHELLTIDESRIQEMYRRRPRNHRQLQSLHQAGQTAHTLRGIWRSVWLVFYGTTEFPIRLKPPSPQNPPPQNWFSNFSSYVVHDSEFYDVYTCHSQCSPGGCTGPLANQCLGGCLHFITQSGHCVPVCPRGTTAYGIGAKRRQSQYRENRLFTSKLSRWQADTQKDTPFSDKTSSFAEASDDIELVCQPCSSLCSSCLRPYTEFECTACSDGRYLVPLLVPNASSVSVPQDALDFAVPDAVGACKTRCPPGYYANKVTGVCQRCMEHCVECTGSAGSDCQLCSPGYRLINGKCLDGQSVDGRCRPGQYIRRSKCVSCPLWCTAVGCLSDGECISCRHPHIYLYNRTCIKTCPSGWYPGYPIHSPYLVNHGSQFTVTSDLPKLSSLRLCEPCSPGCLQCTYFLKCLQCASSLELVSGRCVNTNRTKQQCNLPCSTCHYGDQDCATCDRSANYLLSMDLVTSVVDNGGVSLFMLLNRRRPLYGKSKINTRIDIDSSAISVGLANGTSNAPLLNVHIGDVALPTYTCSNVCPAGTFPASSGDVEEAVDTMYKWCRACSPSCASCTSAEHCTACREGFHLDHSTNTCQPNEQCRASSYFDVGKKACLPCHAKCSACLGPTASDCTSCPTRDPLPYCLDVVEPNKSSSGGQRPADGNVFVQNAARLTTGQCIVCCNYKLVRVSQVLAAGCGFCLADRVTCLSSAAMLIERQGDWLFFPEAAIHGQQPPKNIEVSPLINDKVAWNNSPYLLFTILFPVSIVVIVLLIFICCRIYKRLGYFTGKRDHLSGTASNATTTAVTRREARLHARHRQAVEERREVTQISMSTQKHPVIPFETDKTSNTYLEGGTEHRRLPPPLITNGSVQRWPTNLSTSSSAVNATDPHQHIFYSQLTQSNIDHPDDDDQSSMEENEVYDDAMGTTHASQKFEFPGHQTVVIKGYQPHKRSSKISAPVSNSCIPGVHASNGVVSAKLKPRVAYGHHCDIHNKDAISKPLLPRSVHRKRLDENTPSNVT